MYCFFRSLFKGFFYDTKYGGCGGGGDDNFGIFLYFICMYVFTQQSQKFFDERFRDSDRKFATFEIRMVIVHLMLYYFDPK
jgi:hypothetical protein